MLPFRTYRHYIPPATYTAAKLTRPPGHQASSSIDLCQLQAGRIMVTYLNQEVWLYMRAGSAAVLIFKPCVLFCFSTNLPGVSSVCALKLTFLPQ
jgi:hypothetical protein